MSKKRPGRPKEKDYVKRFMLNIPKKEWELVEQISKDKKVSYTSVILDAINVLFEKEQGDVAT